MYWLFHDYTSSLNNGTVYLFESIKLLFHEQYENTSTQLTKRSCNTVKSMKLLIRPFQY